MFNFDFNCVTDIGRNIIISKDFSRYILILICLLFADSMHGFSVWFSLCFLYINIFHISNFKSYFLMLFLC